MLMVGGSLLSDWPMRLRPIRWRRRGGSTPPCAETLAAREPVPGARSDGGVFNFDAPWTGSPKAAGEAQPGVVGIAALPTPGAYEVLSTGGRALAYG